MEGIIILVLLALTVLILVLPIAAMVKAAGAERRTAELAHLVNYLDEQVRRLKERGRQQDQPAAAGSGADLSSEAVPAVEDVARSAGATTGSELKAEPASPPPLPPVIQPPSGPVVPQRDKPSLATALAGLSQRPETVSSTAKPQPAPQRTAPTPSPLANFNWEQFMGVRMFAWLGGFALFLAAAFFMKYSFDHGWIPPWLRVSMGFATGIGLIIAGLRLSQKRYKVTADTLCGTGIVILYVVTFACRSIYEFEFFGVIPTFLLMVLITATAFLLSVRLNALVVAVLGMLGGFLTPLLVNTGHDNPGGLFTYIALLDIGLIAVAYARRWNWLNLAAALGTVAMQFGWAAKFYVPEKVYIAMAVFLSFCALFTGASAWARRRGTANLWLICGTLLIPAAAFIFTWSLIDNATTGQRPGVLFTFLLGADLAVLTMAFLHAKALVFTPAGEEDDESGIPPTPIPSLAWLNQAAGGLVFLLLATWMGQRLNEELLFWALGGSLIFAVIHTGLPILHQRRNPDESVSPWAQMFPLLALLVILVPLMRFESISFLVWPFVLLIDLLAIAIAVVTASIGGIVLVLLVTVALALVWVLRIPAELTQLPEMLVVLGVMAALFTIAGMFAGRKIMERMQAGAPSGDGGILPPGWLPADVQQQIPALAGVMPFLLLMIVTARLPLLNPSPVFGLGLLLVALLLGLSRVAGMTWLPAVGLGCAFLLENAWHLRHFSVDGAGLALGWYLAFYAAFMLYPFVFHRGDGNKVIAWSASALAGPLHFWLIYQTCKRAWPNELMGMIPALFAVPAIAGLVFALKQIPADHPRRNTVLAMFGGVALFFITLVFPIQFERQWLTVAWALEGAALLWLFHRIPHRGLPVVGVGLLIVAFARLALNPAVFEYHARAATPIFNWYLYSYGLVIAAMFAGAKLLAPPREKILEKDARPLLITMGTILGFLLMNIEIADYFAPVGQHTLMFSFHGNFARDMSYTIGWALFAFVLLVVGILRRIRPSRWAGIALLAVTLLKLFLHDLAALNQLYRVGALVGVAIVAIVASFLYQKFLATGGEATTQPRETP